MADGDVFRDVSAGEPIGGRFSALWWNSVSKVARDANKSQRPADPVVDRSGVSIVMLTETITGSTWTSGTKKLLPVFSDCLALFPHSDHDGTLTYGVATERIKFFLSAAITVSDGYGRLVLALNGEAIAVDCRELLLPVEE